MSVYHYCYLELFSLICDLTFVPNSANFYVVLGNVRNCLLSASFITAFYVLRELVLSP